MGLSGVRVDSPKLLLELFRELRHNRGARGYCPKQADELAQARRQPRSTPYITPQTWALVEAASPGWIRLT
jgi:hypothetical protein